MAKHTKACAWWASAVFSREGAVLHENLAEERGGERKHISAAVRRSKIIIGPPRRGQDQVEVEGGGVERPSSSPGRGSGAASESKMRITLGRRSTLQYNSVGFLASQGCVGNIG